MADVSGISIDVDINIGEAMTKIATLKASLMSIGEDLDMDLDFEDIGLDELGLGEESFDLSKAIDIDEIDPDDLDLGDNDIDLDDKLTIKADADVDLTETTLRDAVKSEDITPDKIKDDLDRDVRVNTDFDFGEMEDSSLRSLINDVQFDQGSGGKGDMGDLAPRKTLLSFLGGEMDGGGGGGSGDDSPADFLDDILMGDDFGDIGGRNKGLRDIFSDARDQDGIVDTLRSVETGFEKRDGLLSRIRKKESFRPLESAARIGSGAFPVGMAGNAEDSDKRLMAPNIAGLFSPADGNFADSNRMFRGSADGIEDTLSRVRMLKQEFGKVRALNPMGDKGGPDAAVRKIAKATPDLRDALPTMRMWWTLLGAILPLLISTAGAALGLAAAFGTVAGAGAAILGLGLIGHAQGMEQAMQNAKQQVQDLKKEMFQTFQGPAQAFAPIQSRIFDMLPGESERLAESLEGATAFEDTVVMSIRGLIGWATDLVGMLVGFQDEIHQAVGRFGNIIGQQLMGLVEFGIREVTENQGSLIAFGSVIKDIIIIVFRLAKLFSGIAVAFAPFIELFRIFTGLLQNDFLKSLTVAVATFLLLSNLMAKLGIATAIKGFYSMASSMMSATISAGSLGAALEAIRVKLATILGMTGIGFLLAAAGSAFAAHQTAKMQDNVEGSIGGGNGFGARGNTVINNQDITVEGDIDRQSLDKLGDNQARTENGIIDTRDR